MPSKACELSIEPSSLDVYLDKIKKNINKIISRPTKKEVCHDILESEDDKLNLEICLKIKQMQMKYGEI